MTYLKPTIVIFLMFVQTAGNLAFCQSSLSKQQIASFINADKVQGNEGEFLKKITSIDSNIGVKLKGKMEFYRQISNGTIILCFVENVGNLTSDTCLNNPSPRRLFAIYGDVKKLYLDEITTYCVLNNPRILDSTVSKFWAANYSEIYSDEIMPVVFSGNLDVKGQFVYSTENVAHEPKYLLFIESNNNVKYVEFSETDINQKRSIFYADNEKSKLTCFFKLLIQEIKKSK